MLIKLNEEEARIARDLSPGDMVLGHRMSLADHLPLFQVALKAQIALIL
jgi:hypothetical protein